MRRRAGRRSAGAITDREGLFVAASHRRRRRRRRRHRDVLSPRLSSSPLENLAPPPSPALLSPSRSIDRVFCVRTHREQRPRWYLAAHRRSPSLSLIYFLLFSLVLCERDLIYPPWLERVIRGETSAYLLALRPAPIFVVRSLVSRRESIPPRGSHDNELQSARCSSNSSSRGTS